MDFEALGQDSAESDWFGSAVEQLDCFVLAVVVLDWERCLQASQDCHPSKLGFVLLDSG